MEKSTRRKFSDEFKEEAVKLVTDQGYKISEAARQEGRRRLLYVNPPRTGLEPEVIEWIAEEYRPAAIAYLSCSAGTLARDLERLQYGGYRVDVIAPYDFFPHTYHVETLALMGRPG